MLSDYIPQAEMFTSSLLARIRLNPNEPVEMNTLALYHNYDVMTQLAFDQTTDLMSGNQGEQTSSVIASIRDATFAIGRLYHVP